MPPNLDLKLQHVLCPQNQILNYNMYYVPKLQVICCHTIILLLPNHKPSYIVCLDLDLKLQLMLCSQFSHKSVMFDYASFNIFPKFSVRVSISYEIWLKLVVA